MYFIRDVETYRGILVGKKYINIRLVRVCHYSVRGRDNSTSADRKFTGTTAYAYYYYGRDTWPHTGTTITVKTPERNSTTRHKCRQKIYYAIRILLLLLRPKHRREILLRDTKYSKVFIVETPYREILRGQKFTTSYSRERLP